MLRRHSRIDNRSAFTLVELMIVILIIAVLVSLLASAVTRVLYKIPEVQTRTEISEFAVGLQAFMSDYQLDVPPPSVLILNEVAPLAPAPLDGGRSAAFLTKVFGKNLGTGQAFVDWNGDGLPNGPWTLEGEQCLVFYLGGIPYHAAGTVVFNPQGFSTNNMNPALPTAAGVKRKGPYFTFQQERLVPIQLINPTAAALSPGHPVYLDPWKVKNRPYGGNPHAAGWPYAYFSTYGNNLGYNLFPTANHCGGLGDPTDPLYNANRPLPYAATQYINPNSYQIISAGRDGVFGTGNLNTASGEKPGGEDDQANFSSTKLGVGQN